MMYQFYLHSYVQVMFYEYLLCVIIFVVPVINWDIPFPRLWYLSYFVCPVLGFCGY